MLTSVKIGKQWPESSGLVGTGYDKVWYAESLVDTERKLGYQFPM